MFILVKVTSYQKKKKTDAIHALHTQIIFTFSYIFFFSTMKSAHRLITLKNEIMKEISCKIG